MKLSAEWRYTTKILQRVFEAPQEPVNIAFPMEDGFKRVKRDLFFWLQVECRIQIVIVWATLQNEIQS